MDDRLITVAIHTYERAVDLKELLEAEGITASLQNVNLSQPVVASGVRVRIRENDLPLALRIIENAEIFAPAALSKFADRHNGVVLVPVDFSEHSMTACRLAFNIASTHRTGIVLLHSLVDPAVTGTLQLSHALDYDLTATELRATFEQDAQKRMNSLGEKLREEIKAGKIPPVKFTTETVEGVAEDVINDFAKTHSPMMIVMGTRGAETKERELVGSVTAEVLDTCRVPVFTIPATVNKPSLKDFRRIAFFCSLDQEDILALDALARMFENEHLDITLVNIPSKKQKFDIKEPFNALLHYCRTHYPSYDFRMEILTLKNVEDDFAAVNSRYATELIAVPNKKKNVFARLFNPGIAHRLLFKSDIPMIVVPV